MASKATYAHAGRGGGEYLFIFNATIHNIGTECSSLSLSERMRRFFTPRALSTQLESWMLYWFCASSVVTLYDLAFVYFRPKTLPDGSWGSFFFVCKFMLIVSNLRNTVT